MTAPNQPGVLAIEIHAMLRRQGLALDAATLDRAIADLLEKGHIYAHTSPSGLTEYLPTSEGAERAHKVFRDNPARQASVRKAVTEFQQGDAGMNPTGRRRPPDAQSRSDQKG